MKILNKMLPDRSGVYLFKGKRQNSKHKSEILYVGKATSLRDRVRSYFNGDLIETRGPMLVDMLERATSVDYEVTGSVLEALILESKLIKKYQPYYNSRDKDDKSYNYVVITKENFPRVLVVRGKDLAEAWDSSDIKYQFGPFPHGGELREAMKIVRKLFPYRDRCVPESGKRCFYSQIGLCPGVCSGAITRSEYARTVRNIKLFFNGKHSHILKNIRMEMGRASERQNFEEAARLRNKIFALEHINDIAAIKRQVIKNSSFAGEVMTKNFRIEAYDIAHISGTNTVGSLVVMEDGELVKHEYKKFKMRGEGKDRSDDPANLEELLKRRFNHPEWGRPDLIVIDGGVIQRNVALRILSNMSVEWRNITVVSVVKDDRHKAREVLGDPSVIKNYKYEILAVNQEAHRFALAYHQKLRDRL